ncbi:MAG: ATP-dependent Clp protease adaptor ClpS [Candidatus Methylacidiphilales bacterium]|nr:ATP-dependent Clp protease adaptor ClpS [Candidatus Methylacidiphilales bacterium]
MDSSIEAELYEVILTRSQTVSAAQVGRCLVDHLKCSSELANKIVNEVEDLGKAPCFVGKRSEAELLVKVLQGQSIASYMSPI